MQDDEFEFHEVDRGRWDDLEGLFNSRGGPKYCWCMVWRNMPTGVSCGYNDAKKEALRGQVQQGGAFGILGYINGEAVVWCSIAPRNTYRALGGPADASGERVWSIVCFFVPRRLRLKGVARKLVRAAVDHAREKGATVVEAFPVDPDSPSYRFMGFVGTFESMGFWEVGRAGIRRHVMRLSV